MELIDFKFVNMNRLLLTSIILSVLFQLQMEGQIRSITFESNGRSSHTETNTPFSKFIGEWTLKNDAWIQNWGGKTDTTKIIGHHTVNSKINTPNSILSIIDGPEPNGHIFWTYHASTDKLHHLSSFGTRREGIGSGEFYGEGNVRLKVS